MNRSRLFGLFRKGDLFVPGVPEVDPEPKMVKGRSMVGYSRRGFLGMAAAATITAAFHETIIPASQREIIRKVRPFVPVKQLVREIDLEAYNTAFFYLFPSVLALQVRDCGDYREYASLDKHPALQSITSPACFSSPRRKYRWEQMKKRGMLPRLNLDPARLPA